MSMFISSHLIIDTAHILCAHPVQGDGEQGSWRENRLE